MSWSPSQYSKFEAERNRPIFDLLARVPAAGVRSAIDIGCGPGNSTELLIRHLPGAAVTGSDSSREMIEAARQRLPGTSFRVQDIASWDEPGTWDLIFANAVLQWLPNHEELLPRLMGMLAPGGLLAVQMPDNLDEPAHVLMRQVAMGAAWRAKLAGAAFARAERREAGWYYEVLSTVCPEVEVWRTTYYHRIEGGLGGIVEWFKGTGLRPFLQPLGADEQTAFLEEYEAGLAADYPVRGDGSVLLPFPRLFLVGRR